METHNESDDPGHSFESAPCASKENFAAWCRAHRDELPNILPKSRGKVEDRQDAIQSAMAKAIADLPKLRHLYPAQLWKWLRTTARREFSHALHKRRGERLVPFNETPLEGRSTDQTEDVYCRYLSEFRPELLLKLQAVLSKDELELVVRYTLWEQPWDEIAKDLGKPEGTLRSRLSRALRKLRDSFGGEDPRRT